jgi:kumamolisin
MAEARAILMGSARNAVPGAKLTGKTDSRTPITVTVVLKRKLPIETSVLHQHYSLRPHERPVADHAAFARQYGASDEAISAVQAFAVAHGLSVINVDQARRVVELSGPVANMEQAFGTVLHDYAIGRQAYRGRRGPVQLPVAVLPHVEAVLGLDNRPVAKPRFRPRTGGPLGYYPQEIAALYKFPPLDGTGETIALIELSGNLGPQDLATYFKAAGLKRAPVVRPVSVSPGVPIPYGNDTDSDGEVMLDIEVAGAMAPGATIVVYFAANNDQGFYQALSQAVHDPATTAVSISWGSAEKNWSGQSMDAWNTLGQGAALLNVPIFVAAGDHGCTDEQNTDAGFDGQRNVDFPGTCASGVACCGGTNLVGKGTAITNEIVWNDNNGWSTGGGVSTHFQTPAWQSGLIAEGNSVLLMRGVPDVAGDADQETGINIRVNGKDYPSGGGGTSAVAPQWAALTALLSQSLKRKAGFFIPLLYQNPGTTNDITSGNNSVYGVTGYAAKQGWDACTGLGSPNGQKILALLSGAAVAVNPPGPIQTPPVPPAPPAPAGDVAPIAAANVRAFDPQAAVRYGQFVQAAYAMYGAQPPSLTPPPPQLPLDYELIAWVQMQDFIISSTGPSFYGFIAQSSSSPDSFVLAIRGTSDGIEWWDDANAILKVPFKVAGCGSVGSGFARIYETLEVVERTMPGEAAVAARSLRSRGGFSRQVADLIGRHSPAAAHVAGFPSSASVEVTGHSLGAALATLYVMENARTDKIKSPALCTFASPTVGDNDFVAAFDALGLTSWRVVNQPDVVPKLPPEILGFAHVATAQQYSSIGKVASSPKCWHSLSTYLSLIDPTLQPDAACRLGAQAQQMAAATPGTVLSIPAGAATINITINVTGDKG